jgi:hypothetical protein
MDEKVRDKKFREEKYRDERSGMKRSGVKNTHSTSVIHVINSSAAKFQGFNHGMILGGGAISLKTKIKRLKRKIPKRALPRTTCFPPSHV